MQQNDDSSGNPADATTELTALLGVLARVKAGDFTARAPLDWTGLAGKVADSLNDVIIGNQSFDADLTRVSEVVGRQGRLSQRLAGGGFANSWGGSVASVNALIDALVLPTSEMQRVIGAVAGGDLSKKVSVEVSGEMLELKNTINAMVDQLNGFASEVTRVAREVGTEGKLGQAAAVTIEVGGVWKDLTDNVNLMAGNLTGQVRNIAEVTTAVANGDLSKKISIDVNGEFLELKNTVNAMVDQLNAFAGEVTRVAREVGVEGRLGGQAQTTEIGGVWKDLTDNVNQLAANLTNQVRAISEVATAVTEGDLTRLVSVEARGEVAVLKDTVNEMIRNLRETNRQNVEQDWLKTNRERFTRMLQGQRNLETVATMILSELAPLVSAQHGVFYSASEATDIEEALLHLQAAYGVQNRDSLSTTFRLGEGLIGQCATEKQRILLTEVPDDYARINSGLGSAAPLNIIVVPVLFQGTVLAVFELASLSSFTATHQTFLDQLTESIGVVLNTIEADTRTDDLLKQSLSQQEELRAQQEELRESNEDLGRQAALLATRNAEAEQTNLEVQESARLLEEKAGQLSESSRYKSEFIANMSHELRTPLNSLLILAELLEGNPDGNMTKGQVEYASVIRSSGIDLLTLLNDILDLAKVESGTVAVDVVASSVEMLCSAILREFEPVATANALEYSIDVAPDCPEWLFTDPDRLRQVLKNLLANAFKFTQSGEVRVTVGTHDDGWSRDVPSLVAAQSVLSFAVSDTGIGIGSEHQERIFDEFAQGDGTTARLFGGTGLGLSISREYVRLLGGEITLASELGQGSTFTVYLPADDRALPVEPTSLDRTQAAAPIPGAAGDRPAVAARRNPGPSASPLAAVEGSPLRNTRVLVVDDDIRNIFSLTALLERVGADVGFAESGFAAIELLEAAEHFDIVLMDIMMPGMDGYETIRRIRENPRFAALPVVAVTGKVVQGERQRCLDAGADDYVSKPVISGELLAALSPWLPSGTAVHS